jgi:hypothetical protein
MIISKKEITAALAHRTKDIMRVKKAIYAAATIQTTAILVLVACLAVLQHAVHALS